MHRVVCDQGKGEPQSHADKWTLGGDTGMIPDEVFWSIVWPVYPM